MEGTAEKRPRKRPLPGSHLMDKLDTLLSPRRPPPESVTLRRSAVGVIASRETDAMPLSFQNLYTETALRRPLRGSTQTATRIHGERAAGMSCRAIDELHRLDQNFPCRQRAVGDLLEVNAVLFAVAFSD